MTWTDVYLLCFMVGFTLSVLSFLGGAAHIHLPLKWHLPLHGWHHASGLAGRGMPHVRGGLSWFNAMTVMTFLAWFGGIGYILSTHSRLVAIAALLIAASAGIFAAGVVFKFHGEDCESERRPHAGLGLPHRRDRRHSQLSDPQETVREKK